MRITGDRGIKFLKTYATIDTIEILIQELEMGQEIDIEKLEILRNELSKELLRYVVSHPKEETDYDVNIRDIKVQIDLEVEEEEDDR